MFLYKNPNLQEIISKAKNGDKEAQNTLLKELTPVIVKRIQKFTPDYHQREDLLQITLCKILQKLHLHDQNYSIFGWTIATTSNVCYNSSKKLKPILFKDIKDEIIFDEIQDPIKEPLEILEMREIQKRVRRKIQKLPKRLREVCRLHYLKEIMLKNISSKMKIHISSIKKDIMRIKKKLKESLGIFP